MGKMDLIPLVEHSNTINWYSVSLFVIYLLNRRFSRMKAAFTAIAPYLLSVQIDQNIVITQATDAFCKALGFEAKDVVGRPLKGKTNSMNEIWESR